MEEFTYEGDAEVTCKKKHCVRWTFTHFDVNQPRPYFPEDKIVYCILGNEVCPKTGRPHVQGYVHFKKEQRITSIRKMCPISKLLASKGTGYQNFVYCSKGGDYVEYGTRPSPEGDADCPYQEALMAATVSEAMAIIKTKRPRDYCLYGERIEANIRKSKKPKYEHAYTMDQFNHEPLDLSLPVLMHGTSECGKTKFALAHFENPLLVRRMETLKKLNEDNDGIVFDDMRFSHMSAENVIHLLDIEEASDVWCRHSDAHIPKGMRRIFCHNNENPFYDPLIINPEQKVAIDRRFTRFHVTEKLY